MARRNNGCAFGRENRVMVSSIKEDISEMKKDFSDFKKKVDKMYNHLSKNVPKWVLALFSVGGTIIGALITGLVVALV